MRGVVPQICGMTWGMVLTCLWAATIVATNHYNDNTLSKVAFGITQLIAATRYA